MKILIRSILLFSVLAVAPFVVVSQVITPVEIDKLVENTLKTFDVPGIAAAIVKDGQMVFAKGHGFQFRLSGSGV
jgi:CubicO group peptidase (beta-lactamase class C family)